MRADLSPVVSAMESPVDMTPFAVLRLVFLNLRRTKEGQREIVKIAKKQQKKIQGRKKSEKVRKSQKKLGPTTRNSTKKTEKPPDLAFSEKVAESLRKVSLF